MIRLLAWLMLISFLVLPVCAQDAGMNPAAERERDADEDPLNKQQSTSHNAKEEEIPFDLSFYTSIRGRYRHVDSGKSVWEDNGSRLGVNGWYEMVPEIWFFGRYELGFNLLKELGLDSVSYQPDQKIGETLFTRLAYVGLQRKHDILAIGKNWSTYYQVAGFTDRFDSLGGEASGVYNAATDGGASGTGRADQVVQARLNFDVFKSLKDIKPLAINFQLQRGQSIPSIIDNEYGYGFGASTIVELWNNISIGLAYNFSSVDLQKIPVTKRNGLDGNMSALLLGAQWLNENWYLGTTVSMSNNLQTTDKQQYFRGTGFELYAQYQLVTDLWLLGGFNYLIPDSDQQQTGDYLLSYGILGIRYAIDGFSRMIYLESRLNQGRTS